MADEANRDEADKCKRIAEAAINSGDGDKATRFLMKAKRMMPNDASIDAMLAKASSASGGSAPSPPSSSPTNGGGGGGGGNAGPRFRGAAPPTSGGSSTTPGGGGGGATRTGKDGNYTTEQMQLVQRILRTKDYYTILEIPRDSNEDQVKKAYKKLALKLHPDKNKAPGAEEAFKKVSKAVQCLTDSDKKRVYDQYGDEERIPQQQRHYQGDFMTPEDVFAAFFGGGVHYAGGGHQRQQHHHQGGEQQFQGTHLLQMLPVLLLILLTLAGNFASNGGSSRFSFAPSAQYRHERSTATLDVPYYVTDTFSDHYAEGTANLADFERQVEIHYVRKLHSECDHQEKTMYKKVMIAKRKGNQDELQKARKHPRPACKEIETIKKQHSHIFRSAMYMGVY